MPLTLTRGKTFGATEQVTNSKLHQLVDSATGADVDQTNMGSSVGVALRQTGSPSDTDALWVDTNTDPPTLRHYDGSEWVPSGPYALMTNKSGTTRSAGDVVIVDTANAGSYTTTTTANNQRVCGVVMASTSNNADGLVALPGSRVKVLNVNATTAIGDFIATSTSVAAGVPSSSLQSGSIAIALASRTGAGTISEALLITPGATTLAGGTIQFVHTNTTAVQTASTQFPVDDTTPQNTEGDQIMTLAITPNNSSNRLIIEGWVYYAGASTGAKVGIGIFQDSTANALSAGTGNTVTGGAGDSGMAYIRHEMAAGTTSSTTFKVRLGPGSAANVYVNGTAAGTRMFNSLCATRMQITEVKV